MTITIAIRPPWMSAPAAGHSTILLKARINSEDPPTRTDRSTAKPDKFRVANRTAHRTWQQNLRLQHLEATKLSPNLHRLNTPHRPA